MVFVLAGLSAGFGHEVTAQTRDEAVRPAYFAGSWYAGKPKTLAKQVDDLLARATPPGITGKPIAIVSPHAGYEYAGLVAAAGYRCLQGHRYRRVIVLAFSHQYAGAYRGVDVPRGLKAYETPLGQVPIDTEVCEALLRTSVFRSHPGLDRREHSLEMQLPFLQRVVKEFRLVPLYVGRMTDQDHAEAAKALVPWLDEDTLLVASSDFTHYGRDYGHVPFEQDVPARLQALADSAANAISQCDYDGFVDHMTGTNDTICGRTPIRLLLRTVSMLGGATGSRAGIEMSGRLMNDWTKSVTYQSIVLTRRPGKLDERQRATLLSLARRTIRAHLSGRPLPTVDPETMPAALRAPEACFVTLENHGRLRGCIGNTRAVGPLYEAVIQNAVNACQDYRFVNNPITVEEVDQLHIEITSHLSIPQRVRDVKQIIVGRHGLIIALGHRRGLLLPQVAYRRGWTRATFLAQTCRKAGLPADAWKRPEAEIYSFEAEVFGEPKPAAARSAHSR